MSIGVAKNGSLVEAPEGGWGYLVVLCIAFVLLTSFSYMACLGILFADFLHDLGHHTKALTMLPSCFFICFSVTGLFSKYLFERYSVRSVAIVGGVIFCSGSMMIVFVRSLYELLFAYSFMQGIGFGLTMPAMYATFIQYFVKRRVMMMALSGTLQGLAAVGMPLFIEMLIKEYGFRGSVAILGALNLHVLIGVIALHPVEWHQKRVARSRRNMCTVQESEPLYPTSTQTQATKPVWMKIVDLLDLTLFMNPVYTNCCLGMAIAFSADVSFVTIQSTYLRSILLTKDETAQIISIGVATDLASRLILTVVSSPLKIRARPLFLAGVIASIVSLLAYMYVRSFVALAVITGLLGFFRAWFHVPVSILYAELLPAERFPSAYGLFIFVQGICMFALGPFFGWIRDITQSFVITFELIMLAMILCVVPWSIEMMWTNIRKRNPSRSSIEEDIGHNELDTRNAND